MQLTNLGEKSCVSPGYRNNGIGRQTWWSSVSVARARRNGKDQIVRPDDTPIPRRYSSGELGSIYSYLYQGTGNIGECLAFGRICARNAVAESRWDE